MLAPKIKHTLLNISSILEQNQRIVIIINIFIVLAAGLAYSISLGDTLRYTDEQEYFTIANNLVTKGSYSLDGINPTAYRPPGYPLVLALFLSINTNIVILRFLNYLFLAGSIFILYSILQKLTNIIAGILASFIILLYPVLFYTASTLYPQMFGALLFLIFIYLSFCADENSTKYSIAAGLTIGFLILTISTFIFIFAITLAFLIIVRHQYKKSFIIFIISSLLICTWGARNFLAFGIFIPFSTNSGINLLIGNSPNTTPTSGVNIDISIYENHASSLNEVERDIYYRTEAIKYITENKIQAFSLYLQKVLNYFNFQNELATKSENSNLKDILIFLTYYPLIALMLIRLFLFRKYPLTLIEKYFVIIYILNAFFQAIFFTRIRFRLPFDFLLIGFVSIFLSQLINHLIKSDNSLLTSKNEK